MKILIIGGDSRQCEMGARFVLSGYEVYTFGLNLQINGACIAEDLTSALAFADIVLLPLPMSRDGIYINTPFCSGEKILIDFVLENLPKTTLLLCGKMSEAVREKAKSLRLSFKDYYENEKFLNENAYITAEGAVFLSMKELNTTVKGTPFMIIGGGRIAKSLLLILSSLGANVTFAARSVYDLRWAQALGAKGLDLCSDTEEITDEINRSRVIINTVPAKAIPDFCYTDTRKDLIFIELAGDEKLIPPPIKEKELLTLCAKALPSKYAPLRAGQLLFDTVKEIIDEKKGEKR